MILFKSKLFSGIESISIYFISNFPYKTCTSKIMSDSVSFSSYSFKLNIYTFLIGISNVISLFRCVFSVILSINKLSYISLLMSITCIK